MAHYLVKKNPMSFPITHMFYNEWNPRTRPAKSIDEIANKLNEYSAMTGWIKANATQNWYKASTLTGAANAPAHVFIMGKSGSAIYFIDPQSGAEYQVAFL